MIVLAARAGAKKVYAIEASGLTSKARENIKNNGLEDVIEVIQGKVEDIKLDAKVDVIISEWMVRHTHVQADGRGTCCYTNPCSTLCSMPETGSLRQAEK